MSEPKDASVEEETSRISRMKSRASRRAETSKKHYFDGENLLFSLDPDTMLIREDDPQHQSETADSPSD